jgi:hypothetical protein
VDSRHSTDNFVGQPGDTMITIYSYSKCYDNSKNYVARLTGRDSKMTFAREFFGKQVDVDEPGLFESGNIDRKGNKNYAYAIVLEIPATLVPTDLAGGLVEFPIDRSDAMTIAKRMDSGESISGIAALVALEDRENWLKENPGKYGITYKIRSNSESKKAIVGASIESAVNGCWEFLKLLPEKEAKKALAQLKTKVSPPIEPTQAEKNASENERIHNLPHTEKSAALCCDLDCLE